MKVLRAVARLVLCVATLSQQVAFAQGSAQSSSGSGGLELRYDSNARLFHWLRVGGNPVVRGGVPTREAFVAFVQGEAFATVMNNLGLSGRIEEARQLVRDGHFTEAKLLPNTHRSLFLKMGFDQGRVLGPVIWSGTGPLDVWVVELQGLRLDVPKGCANVGLTPNFETRIVTERIEVPVPGPVQRVEVPVNVDPCQQPDWNGWTNGRLGAYAFKQSKAKKVRTRELLEGRWDSYKDFQGGQFEFWQPIAVQPLNGRDLRSMVIEQMRVGKPDLYNRKVQHLTIDYNRCTDTLLVDVYWEGWHWKEFIIGFVAGFATGYLVRWATEPTTEVVKGDFFNPGNSSIPVSGMPGPTTPIGGRPSIPELIGGVINP